MLLLLLRKKKRVSNDGRSAFCTAAPTRITPSISPRAAVQDGLGSLAIAHVRGWRLPTNPLLSSFSTLVSHFLSINSFLLSRMWLLKLGLIFCLLGVAYASPRDGLQIPLEDPNVVSQNQEISKLHGRFLHITGSWSHLQYLRLALIVIRYPS